MIHIKSYIAIKFFEKIATWMKENASSYIDVTLLSLAIAPIIDGLYISWLANGLLSNSTESIVFGITALSGGGCIGAVISNEAPFWRKLSSIVSVYLLVLILALVIAFFKPFFASVAPESFSLLTSAFLITLGVKISGWKILQKAWGINPGSAIRILLIVFLANAFNTTIGVSVGVDIELVTNIIYAVIAGFLCTSTGLLFSILVAFSDNFNFSFVRQGQAGSLICIGFAVLFPVIPPWVALFPLATGFVLGFSGSFLSQNRTFIKGDAHAEQKL